MPNAGQVLAKKSNKADPKLVKDQLQTLQGLWKLWGPEQFMKYMVFILAKKGDARLTKKKRMSSRLVPFTYNPIQRDLEAAAARSLRNIYLKPRQAGYTTWVLLRKIFVPTVLNPGTNGFLISQNAEKATEHFRMVQRAHKFFGSEDPGDKDGNDLTASLHQNLLHIKYSNRKEIVYDELDSSIMLGSAEVVQVGQGSSLHRLACSEVARWPGDPEETLANLKEAVVLDGTVDLESTANTASGYFFEECQRAERGASEFQFNFHEWWWEPDYRLPATEESIGDLDADERRLVALHKLDLQQIAFRRAKKLSLRYSFEEKYPEDSTSCFLMQGNQFFDKDILKARLGELQVYRPLASIAGGSAKLFKRAIKGKQYIIGADVASGKQLGGANNPNDSKTDFSAAKVIDYETGEEVASYLAKLSTVDFALDLITIGTYYNNALIAVERGAAQEAAEGGTVILTMNQERYPNVYKHKEWWKRNQEKTIQEWEGFPTNARTRPVMLNRLKSFIEDTPELVHDLDLVRQCLVFVRNEKGRPAAAAGAHDDMVMASAIVQLVRLIRMGYYDPLSATSRERYGELEGADFDVA